MAHENNPDYMQKSLPRFRIVVDGMYYCGELVNNTYTFNDPFSSNSFHTTNFGKSSLEFSENSENSKLIEGRNNLASHVKRVIDFVLCGSKLPREIKIEREPFIIPLKLNIDKFLDIESENSDLQSTITQQADLIERLKEDAIALAEDYCPDCLDNHSRTCPMRRHPIARKDGAKCTCGYEAKYERHTDLMNSLEGKE